MNLYQMMLSVMFRFKKDKTDLVGYEDLIEFIKEYRIYKVPGDFVEIGTLFGGGARKLARFLKQSAPSKKLYVIDIFDLSFDSEETSHRVKMSDFYNSIIKTFHGKTQYEIFSEITSSLNNIRVIKGDSKKVSIPAKEIAFTFIDGNHNPDYIENDFHLVWDKTSVGGCIAFHDYKSDLPKVTSTINRLTTLHEERIKTYEMIKKKVLFIIKITNTEK